MLTNDRRTANSLFLSAMNHHLGNCLPRLVDIAPFAAGVALVGAMLVAPVYAQEVPVGCGSFANAFGPFDYRSEKYIPETTYGSHRALLNIVEHAHFTPQVEAGIRGQSSARAAGDISYTLRAFPNHHRALIAISNISIREKTDTPTSSSQSVECWFQRAIAWKPDDLIVRLIYASHLTKTNRQKDATQQAGFVAANAGKKPFTHLNVGLVYFDMDEFELARKHAQIAIQLGLSSPILKDLLIKAGKWTEATQPASDDKVTTKP
jgi:hypothetical protein